MKIGIDIRALGSKHLTGIGVYIFNAIKNILEIDKDNQYYLFSSGLKNDLYTNLDFNQKNVEHIHVKASNKLINLGIIVGKSSKVCRDFFKQVDLFWLPNINFCNLDRNCPSILTVHDLSFLHSREFYSLKRRYWHKLVKVDNLVSLSSHIIAISENTKRDLMRFFSLEEDKISVINPGIEYTKLDDERANNLLSTLDLPDKFFIYVGTLEPRKNIMSIIKAFDRYHQKYPNTHLLVVGSKGWIYSNILRQIKKRHYVHYLSYVASPLKDALYHKSQGLIWPSFYEGYGFPPMEALAHKKPIIVSYKTSLPEIVKHQALYVDPYNISDIYKSLMNLSQDKKLLEQFRNSVDSFQLPTWPTQAKKIVDIFNKYKR